MDYFITSDSKATFSEDSDFKEVLMVATKGPSKEWKEERKGHHSRVRW